MVQCQHIYMFWSCPRLITPWSNILHTISQVYDVTINPNLLPAPSWRITQQPLCCKAKSFCFKTLLTIRLHTSPPTHNRWIKEVLHGIKLVELLSQGLQNYKKHGCLLLLNIFPDRGED